MAISYDAAVGPTKVAGGVATASHSHTCTGSNRIIFIGITDQSGVPSNLTAVTYNGVSATLIDQIDNSIGDGQTYLYYLIAPASGSNTVSVTRSTTTNSLIIYSASYAGAKQSGVPDASATGASSGGTTQAVTTILDNCWSVCCWYSRGDTSSAGASTTLRTSGTNQGGMFDANSAKTPAGTVTLAISQSGSEANSRVMASFPPFIASTVNANFLMFM